MTWDQRGRTLLHSHIICTNDPSAIKHLWHMGKELSCGLHPQSSLLHCLFFPLAFIYTPFYTAALHCRFIGLLSQHFYYGSQFFNVLWIILKNVLYEEHLDRVSFSFISIHPYPRSWINWSYLVHLLTASTPFVDTSLHDLILVQRSIPYGKSLDLLVEDQSLRLFSKTEVCFSSRGVPAVLLPRTVCFFHTCLWTYIL